jgi:PAS domain S-box-containing protein
VTRHGEDLESHEQEAARLRAEVAEARRQLDVMRQSELKYRRLHETLIDGFVRVDMTGRILEFNDAYREMLGYERPELLDLTYQQLTPAGWHALEAEIIERQVLTRGHSDVYEKEYRRKDGSVFPVELRTILIREPAGPPSGMWAIVRDITDRKRAEQALRESQSWLASAMEVAALGLYRQEGPADVRSTFLDSRAVALLGIPAEQQYRTHAYWIEHLHPADLQRVAEVSRRFETGRADRAAVEYRYLRGPDDVVWIRHVAHAMERDAAGRAVLVIGILQDITEQKLAETALRESEERFRQVAESVSDFIWEVDADGLYRYTSPAVETILGYTPGELVGRKHFYDLFADEDRDELKAAAFKVFADRALLRGFGNRNIAKDGRTVFLQTSGAPLFDAAGDFLGYRGADSDITDRWLAEEGLRNLSRRLIVAQEEERSRVARELHDGFCQTLALLSIKLDLLRQSPPESAAARRASFDDLSDEVKRLSADVRRMSHDLHPMRLEQLGLEAAIRGLCNDLTSAGPIAIENDLRQIPHDAPSTVALCLFRVLQETLQNVVKHSGATRANVLVRRAGDGLQMVVTDNGRGFDTTAPRITASAGLANMRERVSSVSGRFALASKPGAGTRIEVWVPLPRPGEGTT